MKILALDGNRNLLNDCTFTRGFPYIYGGPFSTECWFCILCTGQWPSYLLLLDERFIMLMKSYPSGTLYLNGILIDVQIVRLLLCFWKVIIGFLHPWLLFHISAWIKWSKFYFLKNLLFVNGCNGHRFGETDLPVDDIAAVLLLVKSRTTMFALRHKYYVVYNDKHITYWEFCL